MTAQRIIGTLILLMVAGCDDSNFTAYKSYGEVILIRNGGMEKSNVGKFADHCWVAWYKGIEHIILKRDGTALDPPFRYTWEPLEHIDRIDGASVYFDKMGCKE